MSTTDEVYWSDDVEVDKEEESLDDTINRQDPPHMDEVDSKGFTSVVGGQPLIVEETIKPVKAATSGSVRKRLTRSDNFRKLIKKRSLKDDDKDQVKADASAANDNEMNDLLESKQKTVRAQETSGDNLPDVTSGTSSDMSPTHDSLGRPISGLGPVIAHTTLKEDEDTKQDNDDAMDDNNSDTDSVNTEDGINDSITNMDLLKGYLYSLLMWILTKLWEFADMGVSYVYTNYLGGETAKVEVGQDETDKNEAKQKEIEAKQKRVFNICNELLTTEREYAKRLEILAKIKARTATILQPEIAKSMFQNVDVIQQFHQDNLLPQLEERIACWNHQQKIGDVMRKLVPFLKLYTEYVKNFQKANELFEQWRQKSNTFATFVEEAENNIEYGRLKVQAHMLEPVQRVPRYELLLKDYLKHIPQESPDRPDAEEALQLVGGAAKHFEEMMKRDSRVLELMRLQTQFEGTVNFLSLDRELLHQGKIREVNSKAGKISDRVIHLFNDLLVVSSHQKYLVQDDKFRVKHELPLKSAKVSYGNNLEVQFTFSIKTLDTAIELAASSAGERRMWILKINRVVYTLNGTADSEEELGGNDNESTVEDSQLRRQCTFQISADLKTWKKRIFSLYENGLITTSKTSHDKGVLATVHIKNYQLGIGMISQKKSKVLTLVGDHRTYYLFDESEAVVESWFEDTSLVFYCSWFEELKKSRDRYTLDISADGTLDTMIFVRQSKSRMSTASTDSGIDAMSYTSHNSQASFDAP